MRLSVTLATLILNHCGFYVSQITNFSIPVENRLAWLIENY